MSKLHILTLAFTGVLLTACAPKQNGAKVDDSWLRVTPLDIAVPINVDEPSNMIQMNTDVASSESFDSSTVNVYRYFDISTGEKPSSLNEDLGDSFRVAGAPYLAFSKISSLRVAIYACEGQGDAFTSTDPNCEGQNFVGQLGYLDRQASDFAPHGIYRCVGSRGHMDALDPVECQSFGLRVETILGYAQ